MLAINTELLGLINGSLKFIENETGIVFFAESEQHRDIKTHGLSYEDDHRGNAVAGLIKPGRVEIRYHEAFADERIKRIWARVLEISAIACAGLGRVYYQGREIC